MGMEDMFAQVWDAAKLAGPFATMLTLFLWYREDSQHRTTKETCETERKALQAEADGLRDARLADALKALPILEQHNTISLALSAAMENRNRSQDVLAQVLSQLTLKVEHLEETVVRKVGP
jgi:hypothetical protein